MFFVYKKFRLFFNGFWRFGRWAQNAKCRAVPPKAGSLGNYIKISGRAGPGSG